MYPLLAFIAGLLISIMIMLNGQLSFYTNNPFSLLIIHIVGVILLSAFIAFKKVKLNATGVHKLLFFGGVLGVIIVGGQSASIGKIGLSTTIMLVLASQVIAASVIDYYFSLDGNRDKPSKLKIISFLVIFSGIITMTL